MAAETESTGGRDTLLTVAAVQFEPKLARVDHNRDKLVALIGKAFAQGAKLVVTPEMSNCGYIFRDKGEAAPCAEEAPGGPTVQALEAVTAKHGGYLVFGLMECDGDKLFNTAVLVGPDGYLGKYRKNHLWDGDKSLYEPGDLGFPVFDLPFGRVGMTICYDHWFPEVSRIYALQGVDVICNPTNWVVLPGVATPEQPTWAMLSMVNAHVNSIYIVNADRIGTERGVTFGGSSCVTGFTGFVSGPVSGDREEILVAEIDLALSRAKMVSPINHLINDRRTDVYGEMLGYRPQPTGSKETAVRGDDINEITVEAI